MGRLQLKVWLNQKIANVVGDLPEQEPLEDPSPVRAGCRIFFVVGLVVGFSLLLVYNFIDAPDARVVQVPRLAIEGDENHAFPSCFLYDRSSPNCTKWSPAKYAPGIPVTCPCTNTSAPWKNFVKFYTLHENSTDWNMSFYNTVPVGKKPYVITPNDTIPLPIENVVRDTESVTAERFCDLSSVWPIAENSTTSTGFVDYITNNVTEFDTSRKSNCVWMATLLFNGSNPDYEDRTRSTQNLTTATLLSREELNTNLAQLARDSILTRRLPLDMALSLRPGSEDFRRFFSALADLLTGLLDRDKMDFNESYVYGARQLSSTLSSNQEYDDNALIWYLGDNLGPIFMHTQIDWDEYRQFCFPKYCEVTLPMRKARKLYWAFGILGGVSSIVLTVVTKLLWPCTGMLLLWTCRRNAGSRQESKRYGSTRIRPVELPSPHHGAFTPKRPEPSPKVTIPGKTS